MVVKGNYAIKVKKFESICEGLSKQPCVFPRSYVNEIFSHSVSNRFIIDMP